MSDTQAFPYTASINEPQTVSLPLPADVEVPKPSITSLNPTECTLGDESFTLYITGENFFPDSKIYFAGQPEPTTLNEDGTLSTGINMDVWHGPDTVPVVVQNGPEQSAPVDFTFNEAAPEADDQELEDEIDETKAKKKKR
jgi:hypothetical protein